MLVDLKVANFALIEDLNMTFSPGLNVLSGETGAGKSIVIGAINLIMGERAAVEQIRQGEEKAYVEGIISCPETLRGFLDNILEEAGISFDGELILAREVYRSGRSVARVNGRAVPVSFLRELGQYLVDLHGQHQHQSLLRPEQHLELLDSFGGEEILKARADLTAMYRKGQELTERLASLGEDGAERERHLDVYAFQLKEIRGAGLYPGEDDKLLQKERILANAEKICTAAAGAYNELYAGEDEGASGVPLIDRLKRSAESLAEAARIDENLETVVELMNSAAAQLEEGAHELRSYQTNFEYDPGELAAIQERLNLIQNLKRKYGSTIEEIIAFADKAEQEMQRLQNSEILAEKIKKEIAENEEQMRSKSLQLRRLRLGIAETLEKQLEECLRDLAMPEARFAIKIIEREKVWPKGMDHVEFFFSANRGEEIKPLARIVSGGEVSRVMLALKTILAEQDLIPTLIFDEVDSGIGGATVQAVAEKLARLAGSHQVMCVTHSPQIAAMADSHFCLFKKTVGKRTLTLAERVTDERRREELARMLDGAGIDQISLRHVDSLLARAESFKKSEAG
ncbi:MAG TPA: DNA repair protein RecN [Firmicutes bacterium]|nr:DNA repair protein RecN [Bacillota bacterium]